MIYRRGDVLIARHECAFSVGKFNGIAVIVRFAHNRAVRTPPLHEHIRLFDKLLFTKNSSRGKPRLFYVANPSKQENIAY